MLIGEWRREQEKDSAIQKIIQLIQNDMLFKYRYTKNDEPELQNYLKTRKSLCMVDTLLHCKVQLKNHIAEINQFVLPKPYHKCMVLACHNETGHLGMDRTLLLLQDQFYWPVISKDIREHIRTCDQCQHFKDRPDREEIGQTEAQYPLEMVHVDFLMIGGKKDERKDINVLVVTDHFTRYAQVYITSLQTTVTVAKVFLLSFLRSTVGPPN